MSLQYPSERIRELYNRRRENKEKGFEPDEIDINFGNNSTLEKAIIEYLDEVKLFGK